MKSLFISICSNSFEIMNNMFIIMSAVHGSLVETPPHNNHNNVVLLVYVNNSWFWMNRAFYAASSIRPLQIDFLFPVHRPHGLFVKPENSIISVN